MEIEENFLYTKEHEWVSIEDNIATMGITDYAQDSLGDIVFVELPKVGSAVAQGKVFGSVESVKAVSDLYSPVSGTVVEVNEELSTAPEKINTHPHESWIIKVELTAPSEVDKLLSAEDYEKYVKEETH